MNIEEYNCSLAFIEKFSIDGKNKAKMLKALNKIMKVKTTKKNKIIQLSNEEAKIILAKEITTYLSIQDEKESQVKRREIIEKYLNRGAQTVFTPYQLCGEMIGKTLSYIEQDSQFLVLFNAEFVEVLIVEYDIDPKKITFITDNSTELDFVDMAYGIDKLYLLAGKNSEGKTLNSVEVLESILETNNMKFDVVVMNPPYQSGDCGDSSGSGHTLWNKFVNLSLEKLIKDNGYLCSVHPSGWRGLVSQKDVLDTLKENDIKYLEIHDIDDGIKTFGAATRYDWYVCQKSKNKGKTIIKDQEGKTVEIDTSKVNFIPNCLFDEINKLLAKDNEEKVDIVFSSSIYCAAVDEESKSKNKTGNIIIKDIKGKKIKYVIRKSNMSNIKKDIFKYPCVKYISKKDYEIDLWYSSENKEHFGVPKVMFGVGSQVGGILIDYNGDYGLCDFVAGIAGDTKEELEGIKKALESEKFKNIMSACQFGTEMYSKMVISLFRKDFWKEFI